MLRPSRRNAATPSWIIASTSTSPAAIQNVGNVSRPYLYSRAGGVQPLQQLRAQTTGYGLNDRGDAVGEARDSTGPHAWGYTTDRGMRDLTSLIDPSLGVRLLTAFDIDNNGRILAQAFIGSGTFRHAVILTPVGLPAPCYANCDGSTAAPVLNVNDFVCFQGRFAAADEQFAVALAAARARQNLINEPRILHAWGRALLAAGERARAVEKLDAAIESYRRQGYGARWIERVLADKLQAQGVGRGDVATSIVSLLLLPVYTRFLTPSDYGVIAMLLTVEAGGKIIFRWGVDTAFIRLYYDCADQKARQRLATASTLGTSQ